MSDPSDTEQNTQQDTEQNMGQDTGQDTEQNTERDEGGAVTGVDTNPGDGDKSIVVDTHERLSAKEDEPDLEEIPTEELEKERQERLDPENRPDNVEIDNSQRTFNPETGVFEDSEVDPPEGAPFATVDSESSKDSEDDDESSSDDSSAEEPEDRQESTDADQSKEAKESKDTES